jgi:hypothetical protein
VCVAATGGADPTVVGSGVRGPIPERPTSTREANPVTIIWLLIWFISNNVGDNEPLTLDPVNVWTGTLILAVALDLGRQHAPDVGRRQGQAARDK